MLSKFGGRGSFGNRISCIIGLFTLFLTGRVSAEHNLTCHLPEGPLVLYEDRLSHGWNINWSWGGATSPASTWVTQSTPGGQGGTHALKAVVAASIGGGLEIHTEGGISAFTMGRTVLAFSFRKEMNANITVGIRDSGNVVPTDVPLSSYVIPNQSTPLVNGQWYSFVIPLSDLQSVNKVLGGVVFYTNVPGTMYVDNVMIVEGAFLKFPLDCSNASCTGTVDYRELGAYTPQGINSVIDHKMTAVYTDKDGVIVSFTDETFNATSAYPTSAPQACYPKAGNAAWSTTLTNLYKGTLTGPDPEDNCLVGVALNYEAHPGYDYVAEENTPVRSAAAGTVVNFGGQRCIPKMSSTASCADWGAIGIDYGNGYIFQYLHMSTISVNVGSPISEGQVIGESGTTAPGGVPPHLHFEVLKRVPGTSGNSRDHYKVVDPYGWSGSCKDDPLYKTTGICNVWLWK